MVHIYNNYKLYSLAILRPRMLLKWQQSQVLRSVSDFPFYADAMMPVIITGMSIKPVITDCHP